MDYRAGPTACQVPHATWRLALAVCHMLYATRVYHMDGTRPVTAALTQSSKPLFNPSPNL